jgi:galactoside O-acetyltransferase
VKDNLSIGDHVHIGANVFLFAGGGISIGRFCSISAKTTLYSASDDFSGDHLIGPVIDPRYLKIDAREIIMSDYSAIGAHSVILPGVVLGEGAVLGAMSMANRDMEPWWIYGGVPAKKIKRRRNALIEKAAAFQKSLTKTD